MKVAIPLFNNRVSPGFDFAGKVLIATVKNGAVTEREHHSLINLNTIRRSTLLRDQGVDVVICGGISNFSLRLLLENGMQVIPLVRGEIEEVLEQLMHGHLHGGATPASPTLKTGRYRTRKGRCRGKRMDLTQK